jgi:hypothetical protein
MLAITDLAVHEKEDTEHVYWCWRIRGQLSLRHRPVVTTLSRVVDLCAADAVAVAPGAQP